VQTALPPCRRNLPVDGLPAAHLDSPPAFIQSKPGSLATFHKSPSLRHSISLLLTFLQINFDNRLLVVYFACQINWP
jgi:hypothetical protein